MRRINTLDDLRAERKRLLFRRMNLEREIKNDFQELKESFEPVNFIANGAKKTLGSTQNHLLGDTIGLATNIITKAALRNSGAIPRIVVPLLVKALASKLVERNKTRIFNWIGNVASRVSGKKPVHSNS